MRHAFAFLVGLIFAVGLGLAGMTQPAKVIGFLDFTGRWDPSLAFVMGGGVLVYLPVWRLVKGRARPLFDERFRLPTRKDIDGRLLVGAALFGIGWGLGGYCPGPALTSVGSFSGKALVMVASMLLGMVGFQQVEKLRARSKAAREVPSNGKVAS